MPRATQSLAGGRAPCSSPHCSPNAANVQSSAASAQIAASVRSRPGRVQLRDPGSNDITNVIVNDRDGTARSLPDPLAGDRAAQWIRALHEGSRGGPVWQIAVFLTGVFPPIFAFTGIMMWLRRRSRAAAARRSAPEVLQAAE